MHARKLRQETVLAELALAETPSSAAALQHVRRVSRFRWLCIMVSSLSHMAPSASQRNSLLREDLAAAAALLEKLETQSSAWASRLRDTETTVFTTLGEMAS